MRMRLRQVVLAAIDLAATEAAIVEQLGLSLCYRDPGVATFGLRNALFPVGHQLLEVVSPTQDGTTAGRLLDKRGGDTGYMVILEVDDLDVTPPSPSLLHRCTLVGLPPPTSCSRARSRLLTHCAGCWRRATIPRRPNGRSASS